MCLYRSTLFLSLLVCTQSSIIAQNNSLPADCPLEVSLQVQARLDSQSARNFEATHYNGFRILLYSGNDREKAGRAKENAYQLFPKGDVYTNYNAPTFKVRFGNYYSRLEAWTALLALRTAFPQAVITKELVLVKP